MTRTGNNKTLRPYLEGIQMAEATGHANLTIIPLSRPVQKTVDYLLAAEAIEAGVLTVTEVSSAGSVPQLMAINDSPKLILLLDGEELVGAKQNRILNTTALLAPKSRTTIPVSCVEQGRWHQASAAFCAGTHSPSRLRALNSKHVSHSRRESGRADSDQGAVWDHVAECAVAYAAVTPTHALHDVVEQRRPLFDAYVNALPYPLGACGVVVAIDGRFAALDLFDKPSTLEALWPRLVTGYAVDAAATAKNAAAKASLSAKGAAALLEHIGEIKCTQHPGVGVGQEWRFEAADLLGHALVAEEVCVHLGAFPNEPEDDGRGARGPRILPPSRRRRHGGDDVLIDPIPPDRTVE